MLWGAQAGPQSHNSFSIRDKELVELSILLSTPQEVPTLEQAKCQ